MLVAAGVLIAAGLAVGLASLVTLHVLPSALSPVRAAVSQYGITRYRSGYRLQTLGYAAAGVGAAAGISTFPGAAGVVALCCVFAAARALISWFPMDVPGIQPTQTGRWHGILAITAFVAVGVASGQLAGVLCRDGVHPGIAAVSGVLAVLMACSLIAMAFNRRAGGGYFGLIERSFYLWMTAWLTAVAIMFTLSR